MLLALMLASVAALPASARAETSAVRARSRTTTLEPLEFRFSPLPTAHYLVLPIGVAGEASLGASPRAGAITIDARRGAWSICLGLKCQGARVAGESVVDTSRAASSGSVKLITDLGPIGTAALALFSDPTLRSTRALAMRVAPMFALGGGGLEMRCIWW